jgi:predicted DNA-binding transcriptional regulator AlpA
MNEDQVFLTKKELAAKLRMSPRSVMRWVEYGLLPEPIRLGPYALRWDAGVIAAFLKDKANVNTHHVCSNLHTGKLRKAKESTK